MPYGQQLDPALLNALGLATGYAGGAGGTMGAGGYGAGMGGGGMDLSWLGQLGGMFGSQGYGNTMNGLNQLGMLLGGQNYGQGGMLGMMGMGGGGQFGGLSGMNIPDEFRFKQISQQDIGQRLKNYLKDFYAGFDGAPGQWEQERYLQGEQLDTVVALQELANELGMADIDLRRVLGLEGLGTQERLGMEGYDLQRALGMAGIDLQKVLGLEGIGSQERLGMAGLGADERLGMQGFRSSETNTAARMNALAQAMASIFGATSGASGMTAAPMQGSSGGGASGGGGGGGGGAQYTGAGGDMFSGVEGQLQGELSRPTTLNPSDYAGIASRGNHAIEKQAQAGAQAINRNSQRSGLGFNPGMMNRQAAMGADARGQFANNLADAEISDRMTTAGRRPGYLGMLGDIAAKRQQGQQWKQGQALGMLPYFWN